MFCDSISSDSKSLYTDSERDRERQREIVVVRDIKREGGKNGVEQKGERRHREREKWRHT